MIEVIKQQFAPAMSDTEKINRSREFLQIMTLKNLSDQDAFKNVAFVGGTALRVLYDLRRFSEDLDFSLTSGKGYDFEKIIGRLQRHFELNNLPVECKPKADKTVNSVFIKFPGLLKELGLGAFEAQKLAIKLEVDTNPPKGWQTVNTPLNKTYIFSVSHFDLPSLFATKLHACFFRKYTKGRDFYDLVWYLGKKVQPNLELLNNAIVQTEGANLGLTEKTLQGFMLQKLGKIDFAAAVKDVQRFVEDDKELNLINRETLTSLIKNTY